MRDEDHVLSFCLLSVEVQQSCFGIIRNNRKQWSPMCSRPSPEYKLKTHSPKFPDIDIVLGLAIREFEQDWEWLSVCPDTLLNDRHTEISNKMRQ
ncbi:hypothetical protein WA026_010487 [Henosepilachna vigintioctopunctata]|uniref:Uncharacterized protein n=1 Tax=Henosepilachna vigintioctopunctata TaxID=420089 RepID=A0AAW1VB99_9CUCU